MRLHGHHTDNNRPHPHHGWTLVVTSRLIHLARMFIWEENDPDDKIMMDIQCILDVFNVCHHGRKRSLTVIGDATCNYVSKSNASYYPLFLHFNWNVDPQRKIFVDLCGVYHPLSWANNGLVSANQKWGGFEFLLQWADCFPIVQIKKNTRYQVNIYRDTKFYICFIIR